MNKMQFSVLGLLASIAFLAPHIFSTGRTPASNTSAFLGWPSHFEGKALEQLPLTDKETLFVKNFPGKIARFSDGTRELIIRWVQKPTRKLHPASDCFKGLGYRIKPLPLHVSDSGITMGCFSATKPGRALKVCEYLESNKGQRWSDVSAWYWEALFSSNSGAWMSYVIAQRQAPPAS